jgi:hypothetical protein
MPEAPVADTARFEQVERSVRQQAGQWSQTKHGVQKNRQIGVNHINQQAAFEKHACRTYP